MEYILRIIGNEYILIKPREIVIGYILGSRFKQDTVTERNLMIDKHLSITNRLNIQFLGRGKRPDQVIS